ncbi:hypothetical protein 2017DRC82_0910 [Vibrio phage ICP1]|nr:hypothetical protein 2017DRC106_0905 [Vibrio phage ICP1]HAS2540002.1 hypothetical protein [Vibrio cholerae]QVV97809.1 hypothetical protein 2017DRC32_0905 [Vibrio phage ICP1]QVV98036.1 hypothetical protein 2017DRC48_0905 [Vibrio phage ICP1]QVV98263.1 hypothetical protein 2017DRC55_0905 [Vibrio phage ICP1]
MLLSELPYCNYGVTFYKRRDSKSESGANVPFIKPSEIKNHFLVGVLSRTYQNYTPDIALDSYCYWSDVKSCKVKLSYPEGGSANILIMDTDVGVNFTARLIQSCTIGDLCQWESFEIDTNYTGDINVIIGE